MTRFKNARAKYLAAKSDKLEMSDAFLSGKNETPLHEREKESTTAIQNMLSKAHIRSRWRKIKTLTKENCTRVVTTVEFK